MSLVMVYPGGGAAGGPLAGLDVTGPGVAAERLSSRGAHRMGTTTAPATGERVNAIASDVASLSGLLAYVVVAALVFGETALFLGFVLPGEAAVVLGGVLASRGRVSLPWLILVVVAAAIIGPLVGYEVGRRMGGRVIGSRFLRRMSGTLEKATSALNSRGAAAVLVGRFTAVLRALMPALAGTARMPYRTFVVYNAIGGLVWGVGYCLLGYLAGSAYLAVERQVGTGFAIAIAGLVVAALGVWAVRRHRRAPALAENTDRGSGS
jgi:membrane protein DedA with SNARE-associated domain